MTGNSEGSRTDILVNGKCICFVRLFCVSPKWGNGNEFYSQNQFLFCFEVVNGIKPPGMVSQKAACAVKLCLCFIISSVAVVFVPIYLRMMRRDLCCSLKTFLIITPDS